MRLRVDPVGSGSGIWEGNILLSSKRGHSVYLAVEEDVGSHWGSFWEVLYLSRILTVSKVRGHHLSLPAPNQLRHSAGPFPWTAGAEVSLSPLVRCMSA